MKTILIIDDDPNGRISLSDRLKNLINIQVETAACGQEAIDRLEHRRDTPTLNPYDLIIIDMWVPVRAGANQPVDEQFGLKLIRLLRQDPRLLGGIVPMIVFTAHANLEMCRAAFRAGAVDYLSKSGDLSKLSNSSDHSIGSEDNKSTAEATDYLVLRVRQELGFMMESNPVNTWVRSHIEALQKNYSGQWIAPIPECAAHMAGLQTPVLDGMVILADTSKSKVTARIQANLFLALENPRSFLMAP